MIILEVCNSNNSPTRPEGVGMYAMRPAVSVCKPRLAVDPVISFLMKLSQDELIISLSQDIKACFSRDNGLI